MANVAELSEELFLRHDARRAGRTFEVSSQSSSRASTASTTAANQPATSSRRHEDASMCSTTHVKGSCPLTTSIHGAITPTTHTALVP